MKICLSWELLSLKYHVISRFYRFSWTTNPMMALFRWFDATAKSKCIFFVKTMRSENDNTPQPPDQWTNRPFMGNRLETVKVSHWLINYLANLFAVHCGPRSIPWCIQHHIQLTSLSFQVSRLCRSWDTAISIFYLENSRSRSWWRSKLIVTNSVRP